MRNTIKIKRSIHIFPEKLTNSNTSTIYFTVNIDRYFTISGVVGGGVVKYH